MTESYSLDVVWSLVELEAAAVFVELEAAVVLTVAFFWYLNQQMTLLVKSSEM